MKEMSTVDLRARWIAVKGDRTTIEQAWERLERYVLPYRGMFFKDEKSEHTIEWRKPHIYDDTAVMACQTLASSINGALTSFSDMWFEFRFREDELNGDFETKKWLDHATKVCYFALRESDFPLEINEAYLDLVGFGTAMLFEEEVTDEAGNFTGLDFTSIPIKHCFFETDAKGRVLYFYRRREMTPVQIVDDFPARHVPADIAEQSMTSQGAIQKYTVITAIYPRENYRSADVSKKLPPTRRPWGRVSFLEKDGKQLSKRGGFYEMPGFAPRWRKTNDSIWGHSPGMVCMANITTLNDLVELTMQHLGKVVDPPSFVTERGLLSNLDLDPSGLSVVRSKDDFWQMESTARFDVGELRIEKLQEQIRKAYFIDQLELKESPAMSATETNARMELMQRLLGPTEGRIRSDLLDPCLMRTFNIMYRAGRIDPYPQIVVERQGNLDIDYTGPLAKGQRASTANAIERAVGMIQGLGELVPEVKDMPDWIEMLDIYFDIIGVPKKAMKDKKKLLAAQAKAENTGQDEDDLGTAMAEGQVMEQAGKGAKAMQEAGLDPANMLGAGNA